MENITYLIEKLQNSRLVFWLAAVFGFLFILFIRFLLLRLSKKNIKNQRTRLFLKTVINWLTIFILIVYFFTYFSKSSFMYKTLFIFGDTNITIFLILAVLFSVVLAIKLSSSVQEFILPLIYDKYDLDKGLRASMNTFFNYFIITTVVLISLSSIGFDLSSLTVFGSVLGVGIGFGLKNVMSNFISGLIILFEHPIKVGDRIIIDDQIADVEEIKIRATIVKTRVNQRMIIPNSYFLEEKFINRSYSDRKLRLAVEVEVAYGSDVELVEKILFESVAELKNKTWPNILDKPEPRVFFEKFGDSGLKFSIWFWIDSQDDEKEFRIPSDLRFKIIKKFADNNISIPFPQRDIHIKSKNK